MIWLNSISELQYYNAPIGVPCYCAILYNASDLTLQGLFNAGSGSYTLSIGVYTPDGVTSLETATSNFAYYFAVNPFTAQHFFNAKLNSFTSIMCTRACYILRATVTDNETNTVVFDKWTERYCQASCCETAGNISFSQTEMIDDQPIVVNPSGLTTIIETALPPSLSGKTTECGQPLITLRTRFTCFDYFDGNYYAIPTDVLSGTASFGYEKITNMRGKIAKRPRNIERTYSFNCRLQRVESQRVYTFEGYEYFPAWAADEIETQLHSNEIYIDDVQYEFNGGTPFTMASECKDIFRLRTTMSDCVQRQVFGCNPDCTTTNFDGAGKMYVVPSEYADGYFYDENRALIAQSYAELLDYFRNLDGVTSVDELATSPLSCEVYGAFSVTSYGYIPNSFYYDFPVSGNRVFSTILSSIDEICPTYGQTCASPVITEYYVEEQVCQAPEITEWYVAEDNSDVILITGHSDWSDNGTSGGTLDSGVATITINVGNGNYATDPSSPAAPAYINGDIIAVIGSNGWPDVPLYFDSSNSVLTDNNALSIEPNGFVRYFGESTTLTEFQANLVVVDLVYNLINTTEG